MYLFIYGVEMCQFLELATYSLYGMGPRAGQLPAYVTSLQVSLDDPLHTSTSMTS